MESISIFNRIKSSFFGLRIHFQILTSTIITITIGFLIIYFLIEPLTAPSKDGPTLKPLAEVINVIFILAIVSIIIVMNSYLLSRFYRFKYFNGHTNEIFHSTEVDFLQSIKNKVVIGLDNIKADLSAEYSEKILPSITTSSTMLDFFPSSMRNEINAKIKGKAIFTLIEIAYQDPIETNPTNLSKSLNIPPSSLSREIKKLVSLNYLETHVSDMVLNDARFRNFKITPKGFYFLSQLNHALKMTIERLKTRDINVQSL